MPFRPQQCKAEAMTEAMVSMGYVAKAVSNVRQRKSMSASGQDYARRRAPVSSL